MPCPYGVTFAATLLNRTSAVRFAWWRDGTAVQSALAIAALDVVTACWIVALA